MSDLQRELIIDEEFQALILPLSSEEYHVLEENILREGCKDPLTIWKDILLDGHDRYKICNHWNLPFTTTELQVSCREEAMSWICANQLERCDLSDEMRRYLIGKRYDLEKQIRHNNKRPIWAPSNKPDKSKESRQELYNADDSRSSGRSRMRNLTAEWIGAEYHVFHGTVEKYAHYSRAIDVIAGVSPDLVSPILNGTFKISQERIIDLSKLDAMNMHRYIRQLRSSPDESNLRYIDAKKRLSRLAILPSEMPESRVKPRPIQMPIHTEIKNMPKYNPDAEVTGLTLTIPSWRSSIHRVLNQSDLRNITPQARDKLVIALSGLQEATESLLKALKE